MSVAKVVELTSSSPESFEHAIHLGVTRFAKTVHDIKGAWIKDQSVIFENGKIAEYRVSMRVTFLVKE